MPDGVSDDAAEQRSDGGPEHAYADEDGSHLGVAADLAHHVHRQQDPDGFEAQAHHAKGGEPSRDSPGERGARRLSISHPSI